MRDAPSATHGTRQWIPCKTPCPYCVLAAVCDVGFNRYIDTTAGDILFVLCQLSVRSGNPNWDAAVGFFFHGLLHLLISQECALSAVSGNTRTKEQPKKPTPPIDMLLLISEAATLRTCSSSIQPDPNSIWPPP